MLEQFKKFEVEALHKIKRGSGTVGSGSSHGYWGRDHGNSDGIPPDGALRTNWPS